MCFIGFLFERNLKMEDKTLEQMIACQKREISFSQYVYPQRVANGKMTQAEADHLLACKQAILNLLFAQQEKQPKNTQQMGLFSQQREGNEVVYW
jgi:hypothetical protein